MSYSDKIYPDTGPYSPSHKPPAGAFYSVKDQPLPPPATYRAGRSSRSRGSCCSCLWCLCSIVTVVIIALVITSLVLWLELRPKTPKFDVMNVHISNLTNFQTNSTNSVTVSPVTTYQVQINNPNKKIGIYWDKINVDLESSDLDIGQGSLTPFYQGHKNVTTMDGELSPNGGVLTLSSDEEKTLLNDQSDGSLPVVVTVDVTARVKVGSWTSRHVNVKVKCTMNLNLNVQSGSQLSGGSSCDTSHLLKHLF